jgi:synaptotagmin-4
MLKSSNVLDPYVKIYLLFNNQRIAKKKTHVKKRTLNPVFNESFVFDLPKSEDGLASVQLEFMLLDWDRVTKNEVNKCRLLSFYRTIDEKGYRWEK